MTITANFWAFAIIAAVCITLFNVVDRLLDLGACNCRGEQEDDEEAR